MLSRVADSLYWMSRYFERANYSARVLDANYNLMLNPSKPSTDQRWQRITASLGLGAESAEVDPQTAMTKLIADSKNRSSIVSCIGTARENASQVREQISSEMWERLNQLYHEVTHSNIDTHAAPLRLITLIREGSYNFQGVTHSTMNHGEAWQFIRLGQYMERASALPILLDAVFCASAGADDLDWVGLLASCSAFEAYCKVYTADLKPERVAEFLLLNAEFPYTVRYSAEQMQMALEAIARASSTPLRKCGKIEKIVGRLRSSLAYAQIDDIMSRDFQKFLHSINEQCHSLHAALHEVYIEYPIESAFEA